MLFLSRPPRRHLAGHVDWLWSLRDAPAHSRERVVPQGTFELVVNLADDEIRVVDAADPTLVRRYSGAVVSGAFSRFFVIDTRVHASIVGVHFKPAGASRFLGVPVHDLADRHVELEALWGPKARLLREALRAASTVEDRFLLLEDALGERLDERSRRHAFVPRALARLEAGASVAEVVKESGLSHRWLVDVFRQEVGMSPKLYARIRRFERAMACAREAPRPEWIRVAFDCGYFDQSHLIADFVAFSGLTPRELLNRARGELKDGHVLA